MKSLFVVFATVVILAQVVFVGCSGVQKHSDYDPTVEFTKYETWDWLPQSPDRPADEGPEDGFTHARIMVAIEKNLTAKGYARDAENPNFFVIWGGGVKDTMEMSQTSETYKNNPYTEFDWSTTYSYEWQKGYLEISIFDAATKHLAWKGSVEGELKPTSDPEKKNERITNAVDKILADFPPGK